MGMSVTATHADIKDSILDAIGHTPIVRLSRIAAGLTPQVVAKVESLNPGGSIKDRVAVALIEAAERDGHLRPGGTIVEPTSGNTGTGLAIAARLKGYRVIAVMPDKMSKREDRPAARLRRRGRRRADGRRRRTRRSPTTASPTDWPRRSPAPSSPTSTSTWPTRRLTTSRPGPSSGSRPAGAITHLVVGVGTGGTITGTARYLKERNPDLVVVGADPEGSIYSGSEDEVRPTSSRAWARTSGPRRSTRRSSIAGCASRTATRSSTTRRLAQTEGILAGGSGGLAVHAALEVAKGIDDPEAMVVVVLPDGGRTYL